MRPDGEGATALSLPATTASKGPGRRSAVFYNPAMALDRDLGVAVLRAMAEPGTLLGWEMTAATGVRGLRLLGESGAFRAMALTEVGQVAFGVLSANCRGPAGRRAVALHWDARRPLARGAFDYVDLDPYGSPAPFVASALLALRPGGLLAVTATDLAVLAGAVGGVAQARYGGRPVRGRLGPEGGLRLLLAHCVRLAEKGGGGLRPVLAYVLGHHVRFYARRTADPAPAGSVGLAPAPDWVGPALPTGGPYGPLWLGALFDPELLGRLRVPEGAARPGELAPLLDRFREEASADRPFTYEPNELARELRCASPPALAPLLAGIRGAGYACGRAHTRPAAFRTTAPREVVRRAVQALQA